MPNPSTSFKLKPPQSMLPRGERRIGACWIGGVWDMTYSEPWLQSPWTLEPDWPVQIPHLPVTNYVAVGKWSDLLLGWEQEEPREGFQQVGTGWCNWVCREMDWKEPAWVWRAVICSYSPDLNRFLQSGLIVNASKAGVHRSHPFPHTWMADTERNTTLVMVFRQHCTVPIVPSVTQKLAICFSPPHRGPLLALPPSGPLISSQCFC